MNFVTVQTTTVFASIVNPILVLTPKARVALQFSVNIAPPDGATLVVTVRGAPDIEANGTPAVRAAASADWEELQLHLDPVSPARVGSDGGVIEKDTIYYVDSPGIISVQFTANASWVEGETPVGIPTLQFATL